MRKRLAAVGLGAILGANAADAQQPQFPVGPPPAQYPTQPQFPAQPPQFPQQPVRPVPPPFPTLPPISSQPRYPAPGFPAAPAVPGPNFPAQPQPPQQLPPGLMLPPPAPRPNAPASPIAEAPLPHPEQKAPITAMDVQVKRVIGGWQVWAGQKVLRDLGDNEMGARDLVRVFRDLRPTEWVAIGAGAKPVVEYGLTNGRPALAAVAPDGKNDPNAAPTGASQASFSGPIVTGAGAKFVQPIDLRTARAEAIRGAWCVRDDENILFNFGTDRSGAEQAAAVIQKYGFNRVGVVGDAKQPVMNYLFASLEPDRPKLVGGQILLNAQIEALTRTGIPIPGVGYTGEMVKIDARKVEARKDGAEWVVAAGGEVLGRFGPTEWAAREAARTIQDAKFTEFCKLGGTSGLTFFLRDGKPPTRAPFSAQGRNFDPTSLKVQQINGKWAVTEGSRQLFEVGGPQEGETVVRVLRAYGFDQMATLSSGGPKGGVSFMVKNR